MKRILSILFVLALVLSFSLVATTPVAAQPSEVWVDDDFDSDTPDWGITHFDSIQDGVNAVAGGGTVYVAAGTYVEQVSIIDKSITLQGVGVSKPVIQAPAAASRTTRSIPPDESPATFDPIIFIHGETAAIGVTVDYFEIDGLNDPGSYRFTGILARNVFPGVISNNYLHSLMGPQETMGIIVYGAASDVTISDNYVTGFSRNGITANADAYADVVGNTVVGRGYTDAWAQNGIQIGFGATGTIVGNSVSDIGWIWPGSGPQWTASGILGCHASGTLVVESNGLTNVQIPIFTQDTNLIASANEIELTDIGGLPFAYGMLVRGDGADVSVAAVDNSFVDSTGTYKSYGVYFYSPVHHMSVSFHGNLVQGWLHGVIVSGDGTGTTADMNWNSIAENSSYGLYAANVPVVDATHNWWGDASGPYHATLNPGGTGNEVSNNVNFTPWYFVADPDIPITSYGAILNTETGTGPAEFGASHGTIVNLRTVAEATLPPAGKPNLRFPHGFFALDITGLPNGQTVTVSIMLPQPVPTGTEYWKYYLGAWHKIPMTIDPNDSRIIHITLVDGGLGDADATANGTIIDQGGPGNPVTVGWEGSSVNKVAVVAPWIALMAAMMAGALLVVRRRRVQI